MFGSRRGAASGAGTLLMLVSFAAIGGFMYWLNLTTAANEAEVMVEEEPVAEDTGMEGAVVTLADFSGGPEAYEGQMIQMADVEVTSLLGNHAFWTKLTNDQPYLVRVDPVLFERGLSLVPGTTASFSGTVMSMTDSILDAWESGGSFTNDVNRIEAEFAETFVAATAVNSGG